VHDLAGLDYSPTELTNFVNAGRERVALDTHCVRILFQNATIIANQEQYPIFGAVIGGTVTAGGSGYSAVSPPAVSISAPPAGGTQATAVAVVDPTGVTTAVQQINMTNWGSGYVAQPTMTIAPPGAGTPASANAMCTFNVFDWNSVSLLNGTLRYTLRWLPFTPFQAFCRAYTQFRRPSSIWSQIQEANLTFLCPIPDQTYLVDIDAIAIPTPLVNPTDVDTQIIPPTSDCVQWYAAHKAILKSQNWEQAEFLQTKYQNRVDKMIMQRQDRRIISVYQNWWRRMSRL